MKTRILSGIVLVIIMASALVCGSWYLFGLNLMIALIGMFELYRVIHMEKTVMAYAGYIACILYYICIGAGRDEYLLLVLALWRLWQSMSLPFRSTARKMCALPF